MKRGTWGELSPGQKAQHPAELGASPTALSERLLSLALITPGTNLHQFFLALISKCSPTSSSPLAQDLVKTSGVSRMSLCWCREAARMCCHAHQHTHTNTCRPTHVHQHTHVMSPAFESHSNVPFLSRLSRTCAIAPSFVAPWYHICLVRPKSTYLHGCPIF